MTTEIETAEGSIGIYLIPAGIEIYAIAASDTDEAESVDLVLTREQAATLIARLAAVLAEAATA